ncbi:MAG: serine hydrolase [Lyngbya sp.]|nr:serine hydrolase [Lyngbya sp.]
MAQRSPRHLSLISSSSGSRSRESPSPNGSQPVSPRRRRRSRRTTSPQPMSLFKGLMNPLARFKSSNSTNTPSRFSSGNVPLSGSPESLEPLVSQLRQQQQTRSRQQQRPKTPPKRKRTRQSSSSPLPPLMVGNRRNPNLPSPASNGQSSSITPTSVVPSGTSVLSPRPPRVTKRPKRRFSPMIYGARLLILGIGIGVLSGTVLSILSSLGRLGSSAATSTANLGVETQLEATPTPVGVETLPLSVQLNQELKSLQQQILALTRENTDLKPGILLVDLDTGGYVDLNSESALPAASTIKVPILVAFFQAVDEGKISLDELLTMEDEHIAGGSGDMQYQPSGTEYTALETATKMIVISDNTATNMLIERLGGAEFLNQKFLDWGLKNTVIRDLLPDLRGTNKTTARDLVNLLTQLNQGGLVSMKSRDRIFRIMEKTENDTLLPSGLGRGAVIAHKTGNLKSVSADVGLIDLPNGKRYLLAVIVERNDEDSAAESLIRNISKTVYESFSRSPEPETESEESTEDSQENESENSEDTEGEN